MVYGKNAKELILKGEQKDFSKYKNPDNDPFGNWVTTDPSARTGDIKFPIKNPYTGREDYPPKGRCWGFSYESYQKYIKNGKIKFKKNHSKKERGFVFKRYLLEVKSEYYQVNSLFSTNTIFMNQVATKEVNLLFEESLTSYPKPVVFLEKLIFYGARKNDIILDFFAGSCTTADAVMQLNAEDGGTRKFIMVQLPEPCKEDSEAFKSGYKNISEIGKERIRRAAQKIKKDLQDKIVTFSQKVAKLEEKNKKATAEASQEIIAEIEKQNQEILTLKERAKNLDLGFQSFQLTSSNFEEWQTEPQQLKNGELKNLQQALQTQTNPVKKNSKDLDLLFEILLKEGIELAAKITSKTIAGKKVYFVAEHNFYICLEKINLEWMEEILKKEPAKIILLDSGFGEDDELKINCFQKIQILEQQKGQSIILKTI